MSNLHSTERLYSNNDQYFEDLLTDINQAKKTVDLEAFIFANDFLGERVAQHLTAAAQRGVVVRLMIDGMGARLWHAKFRQEMEQAGVQIKIFHPAPWSFWQWAYAINVSEFILKKIFNAIAKTNSRNHRKVTIIDNKIAWIGSINITHEHLSVEQGGQGWRDAAVRLVGSDFTDLNAAFDAEWQGHHYHKLFNQPTNNEQVRLNNTLFRRLKYQRDLARRMRHAQHKIWIINAYFLPASILLKSLETAAKNNVDVRIILPGKSNHRFMSLAGAMFYKKLLQAGVQVYLYQPHMLHEKSMIIDSWATVGTSNLNYRSLFHDLEVDIVLTTEAAREQLEKHFLNCLQESTKVTLDLLRKLSRWKKILGYLLLLWRNFL